MPGPRLAARTSGAQAIGPVQGNSIIGDLAAVATTAVASFKVVQERDDKIAKIEDINRQKILLATAAKDIQKAEDGLASSNGSIQEVLKAATRINAIVNSTIQVDPALITKVSKLGSNTSGLNNMILNEAKFKRVEDIKSEDKIKAEALDNNLPSTLPIPDMIYQNNEFRKRSLRLGNITEHNKLKEQQGILVKEDHMEALRANVDMSTAKISNFWNQNYGLSDTAVVESLDTQSRVQISKSITEDYNRLVEGYMKNSGFNRLSKEEITDGLKGLTFVYETNLKRLNNEIDTTIYKNAIELNTTLANYSEVSTPEDALKIKNFERLSQMRDGMFSTLIGKGKLKGEMVNLAGQVLTTDSKNVPISITTSQRGALKHTANLLFNSLSDALKNNPKYSASALKAEIGMMVGLFKDMNTNPKAYKAEIWNTALTFLASPQGVIVAKNPDFRVMKEQMVQALGVMEDSLVIGLKRASGVSVDDKGVITVEGDPATTTRLNTFVSALANIQFITPKEASSAFVKNNSDIFGVKPTNAGLSDDQKQAQIDAVAAYRGVSEEAARKILGY